MKKALSFISGLLLTSLICSFPTQPVEARDLKGAANFLKFNQKHGQMFDARENSSGRIVGIAARYASLYGPFYTIVAIDPIPAATAFLNEYLAAFGTTAGEFRVEKVEKTENVTHVTFAHYYRGKKVDGSAASVAINGAGQAISLNDGVERISSYGQIMESITAERAEAIAAENIGLVAPRGKIRTSEIICVKDGAAVDAFKVEVPAREPLGDFVCMVSAAGAVLSCENTMNFIIPAGVTLDGETLCGIEAAIGAEKTGRIAHRSRSYLNGLARPELTDRLAALIEADKELYAGRDAGTIAKAFDERGIRQTTAPETADELMKAAKFDALNGDKDAARMIDDIEKR